MNIHPSAIVHPDAQFADDVEVQAYSIIGPHVRIGAGTVVGPHVVIDGDTVIGERNRVFSGAQIGVVSQDLKHREDLNGRCKLGDDNVVREHVTISASSMLKADDDHVTTIGNNCLLMACAHVAHDCHIGSNVIIANFAGLSGHVTVEDKAIISGLSGLHQEIVVGTLSFVGGMARVSKDVPPFMIVEGSPARCVGPNTIGLQRNGYDHAARTRIKHMHRIMFRSNLNTTQALDEIMATIEDSAERTHFVEFFRRSSRGVTK